MDTSFSDVDTATQPRSGHKVLWLNIGLFLLLTFAISWACFIGLRALHVPFIMYSVAGMYGPALASLLVRLLRREGFNDAGLRLVERGNRQGGWMYLAAYLVPPIVLCAGMLVALLSGYQHWAFSTNLQVIARTLVKTLQAQGQRLPAGMTPERLATISIIVGAFTIAIPINMLATFGEEFGWRGYLLPKLAPFGGVWAALIVGVVWGLWHAPLIVLDSYDYPGHPWLGVLMMIIFTTALSCIFAWLRFRSGSVWPSTLAHAAVNAQLGCAFIFLSHGDSLLGAPIGILGLIPMLLFALWLILTGRLNPVPAPLTTPAMPTLEKEA